MDFMFAILGLVILLLAGDSLVRGAVNVSLRLGVPALIVSLTIVAIGTSAPELLISVGAVIEGAPGIALGNVVGSNTANVLLVLGLPAMLFGFGVAEADSRASYAQMLAGTALFLVAAIFSPIDWEFGSVMLAVFVGMIGHAIWRARCHLVAGRKEAEACDDEDLEVEGADLSLGWPKIVLFLVLGLIGLPLGAEILVDAATNIARAYAVPETVIGLTLVAVGTSLPELATTISAAWRKQADVAIGNVVGSNMANILGILGTAALFGKIPVAPEILRFDIAVMVAASLLLLPFIFGKTEFSRSWGILFTLGYIVYVMAVLG